MLRADKEIALQTTDHDGKFSFDQLKPGNYELHFGEESVGIAATHVQSTRKHGLGAFRR